MRFQINNALKHILHVEDEPDVQAITQLALGTIGAPDAPFDPNTVVSTVKSFVA
ncbi:MAG: hypothetical protein Q8N54_15925 [Sulfurimicrobium sp.]|jgi:hypothetical protein|nr:hypothetical protein [Sulfurimicrobium sp.]MDP1705326.1 hypothetical protein [Sulfurimicrobium sp.]MDP2198103.1 hypothetical protein [Sulfurimicrobium sp.]MDP2964241.1 hypothetical protein [Sulfurimicrobium sp.]MDP3687514.1 hypothetical protein [Sulfurimicrobium sp.]